MEFSLPPGSALAAPRRVFTTPTHPASQQHASSSSKPFVGSVDTLYDHPSVKIVAFTAGPRPLAIGPRAGLPPQDIEPGTLSSSSQLERTIAAGPFRIYRAPGSVAFLSCGSALQPILPKSQVWCVDEDSSKFVLQIRRPQYWRIEVPVGNDEDARRAQLLRDVFDKILQFEKTECPFQRAFTVALPEAPSTPVKKRPWTPVRKPSLALPPTPVTSSNATRAKTLPEDGSATAPQSPAVGLFDRQHPETLNSDGAAQSCQEVSPVAAASRLFRRRSVAELRGFYSSRCVTAPPHLKLGSSVAEAAASLAEETVPTQEPQPESPIESQENFHTPQSFISQPSLPPSPPETNPPSPAGSSCLAQNPSQIEEGPEDKNDVTLMSSFSQEGWSASSAASAPSESSECATALSSVCDADCPSPNCDEKTTSSCEHSTAPTETIPEEGHPLTPSISNLSLSSSISRSSSTSTTRRPTIRRATTSSSISPSRRALSPLPSAANLFAPRAFKLPNQQNALAAVRRLPMAVIQKTCEILMSPPSHLINLMLKVAARIAAGEWRGLVFGVDERGEQIPVQWDWSEDEDNNSYVADCGGRFVDEDWPPRGSGMKMAGSFPESDDEEDWTAARPNGSIGTVSEADLSVD